MNKNLLLMGCLQVVNVLSSSIKPVLESGTKKNESSRKVHFFLHKNDRDFLRGDKGGMATEEKRECSAKKCLNYCKNIAREDVVDCCFDNGQVIRFCLLGCLIFAQGYNYGVESGRSFSERSNVCKCAEME